LPSCGRPARRTPLGGRGFVRDGRRGIVESLSRPLASPDVSKRSRVANSKLRIESGYGLEDLGSKQPSSTPGFGSQRAPWERLWESMPSELGLILLFENTNGQDCGAGVRCVPNRSSAGAGESSSRLTAASLESRSGTIASPFGARRGRPESFSQKDVTKPSRIFGFAEAARFSTISFPSKHLSGSNAISWHPVAEKLRRSQDTDGIWKSARPSYPASTPQNSRYGTRFTGRWYSTICPRAGPTSRVASIRTNGGLM
jgi:hypothetical protein